MEARLIRIRQGSRFLSATRLLSARDPPNQNVTAVPTSSWVYRGPLWWKGQACPSDSKHAIKRDTGAFPASCCYVRGHSPRNLSSAHSIPCAISIPNPRCTVFCGISHARKNVVTTQYWNMDSKRFVEAKSRRASYTHSSGMPTKYI